MYALKLSGKIIEFISYLKKKEVLSNVSKLKGSELALTNDLYNKERGKSNTKKSPNESADTKSKSSNKIQWVGNRKQSKHYFRIQIAIIYKDENNSTVYQQANYHHLRYQIADEDKG